MITCPEKPERLAGAPLGQYHCPYCTMMVVAGAPHPRFVRYRKAEDITDMDVEFLGIPKESGYYATTPDFEELGPFTTEEEAEEAWRAAFERITGEPWGG